LQQAEYERGHAGICDVSPDSRAILDRAPGIEGLFLAAGFSGTGFRISPVVGACTAEVITQGQAMFDDITPLSLPPLSRKPADRWPISVAHYEDVLPEDFGHRVCAGWVCSAPFAMSNRLVMRRRA
jgi:sarcosine oxidase subunit beta